MSTISVEAEDTATLLRMWRAGADLTIEKLTERVAKLVPSTHPIGRETVRRYERGAFPAAGPDPLVLAALAIACGRRIGDLPLEAQTDVNVLAELLRKECLPLSRLQAA
jgi:antitoxin (DNA-binding transcriptional repressor) of toxin-antitoxin stability system